MGRGRPKLPDWWKEAMVPIKERTPDPMKEELSGERFLAGTSRGTKRWKVGRKRKTVVKVEEPLMIAIDQVMEREGVSDVRLGGRTIFVGTSGRGV